MDDAEAWEHYNDPANREPAEGPVYRRRSHVGQVQVTTTHPARTWTGN